MKNSLLYFILSTVFLVSSDAFCDFNYTHNHMLDTAIYTDGESHNKFLDSITMGPNKELAQKALEKYMPGAQVLGVSHPWYRSVSLDVKNSNGVKLSFSCSFSVTSQFEVVANDDLTFKKVSGKMNIKYDDCSIKNDSTGVLLTGLKPTGEKNISIEQTYPAN